MKVLAAWREALSRPGLIGLVFALRSVMAAVAAALWLDAFSPHWIMGLPQQDRSLFEPGLAALLRLFSDNRLQWTHLTRVTAWLAAGAAALGAVLVAFVLHALGRKQKVLVTVRKTIVSVPSQLLSVAFYGVAVFFAIFVARRLSHVLPAMAYPALGEKGADAVLLVLALLLAITLVGARVTCDLVRVGLTQSQQALLVVAAAAVSDLRKRWGFWGLAYSSYAIPHVLLPVLVESWLPTFGAAPRFGFWPTLVHQLTIVALSALQLSWWVFVRTHGSVPRQDV